jgi:hypothetical protein
MCRGRTEIRTPWQELKTKARTVIKVRCIISVPVFISYSCVFVTAATMETLSMKSRSRELPIKPTDELCILGASRFQSTPKAVDFQTMTATPTANKLDTVAPVQLSQLDEDNIISSGGSTSNFQVRARAAMCRICKKKAASVLLQVVQRW